MSGALSGLMTGVVEAIFAESKMAKPAQKQKATITPL